MMSRGIVRLEALESLETSGVASWQCRTGNSHATLLTDKAPVICDSWHELKLTVCESAYCTLTNSFSLEHFGRDHCNLKEIHCMLLAVRKRSCHSTQPRTPGWPHDVLVLAKRPHDQKHCALFVYLRLASRSSGPGCRHSHVHPNDLESTA